MPPANQLPSRPYIWPASLNVCWLVLLLLASGTASFSVVIVVLASAGNLLGILIALLRRRWPVAQWYSLALLVVLILGAIALTLIEPQLYQDE
jgi:glucose-6-phosphate-specific signal transduction histidine kinase